MIDVIITNTYWHFLILIPLLHKRKLLKHHQSEEGGEGERGRERERGERRGREIGREGEREGGRERSKVQCSIMKCKC